MTGITVKLERPSSRYSSGWIFSIIPKRVQHGLCTIVLVYTSLQFRIHRLHTIHRRLNMIYKYRFRAQDHSSFSEKRDGYEDIPFNRNPAHTNLRSSLCQSGYSCGTSPFQSGCLFVDLLIC